MINVVDITKRAVAAIANGDTVAVDFDRLQEALAVQQFPGVSKSVALAKFQSTEHGNALLHAGARLNHEILQKRTRALADAQIASAIAFGKAFGNPASRQSEYETPPHPTADETPRVNDGEDWSKADIDAETRRLMKLGMHPIKAAEQAGTKAFRRLPKHR
jgi:hypothetical protein